MGRRRRYIKSNQIYEFCFRARKGLPLPPLAVIRVLIESILARVQHDEKVEIIAFLWMSNHPHIIVRVKDAEAARNSKWETIL
jgi:REP element-mobilizing transposase RayT